MKPDERATGAAALARVRREPVAVELLSQAVQEIEDRIAVGVFKARDAHQLAQARAHLRFGVAEREEAKRALRERSARGNRWRPPHRRWGGRGVERRAIVRGGHPTGSAELDGKQAGVAVGATARPPDLVPTAFRGAARTEHGEVPELLVEPVARPTRREVMTGLAAAASPRLHRKRKSCATQTLRCSPPDHCSPNIQPCRAIHSSRSPESGSSAHGNGSRFVCPAS